LNPLVKGPAILLVLGALLVSTGCERHGHHATRAAPPLAADRSMQALDLAEEVKPDLVLLDAVLPDG